MAERIGSIAFHNIDALYNTNGWILAADQTALSPKVRNEEEAPSQH